MFLPHKGTTHPPAGTPVAEGHATATLPPRPRAEIVAQLSAANAALLAAVTAAAGPGSGSEGEGEADLGPLVARYLQDAEALKDELHPVRS